MLACGQDVHEYAGPQPSSLLSVDYSSNTLSDAPTSHIPINKRVREYFISLPAQEMNITVAFVFSDNGKLIVMVGMPLTDARSLTGYCG